MPPYWIFTAPDKFEGHVPEVMDEIAKEMGFSYEFGAPYSQYDLQATLASSMLFTLIRYSQTTQACL